MLQVVQSLYLKIRDWLLVASLFLIVFLATHHNQSHLPGESLQITPTTHIVDNNGTRHDIIVTKEVTQSQMNHITDSLRKNIKGSIKEVTVLVPVTDTVFRDLPVVIQGDTIEVSKIDSYVSAKAIINTRLKTGEIRLKLTDTLTEARTVKKHLLRSNILTIDITNKNPYTKIEAGSSIIVKQPKVKFVVGPTMGFTIQGNPYVGVGITYNLISF